MNIIALAGRSALSYAVNDTAVSSGACSALRLALIP